MNEMGGLPTVILTNCESCSNHRILFHKCFMEHTVLVHNQKAVRHLQKELSQPSKRRFDKMVKPIEQGSN